MPIYSRYSPVGGGGTVLTFVGTAPISVVNIGGTVTTSMTQSDATTDGWLSAVDWNTFNSKQNALTIGDLTSTDITVTGGTGAVIGSGASLSIVKGNLTELTSSVLTITGGTGAVLGAGTTIQVSQSGVASDGYLSSTDWNTFNSKQNALTFGNLTETGSSVLTITGGTGAVIGSGTTIQMSQAGASTSGFLSSTDWNTFNNKANYPTFSDDQVLYSTTTGAEWRIVGTGSTTAAYPSNTTILGRTKPAGLTGVRTVIIGVDAATSLTSGVDNTAIGYNAGNGLTTGSNNTLMGSHAGFALTSGGSCTIIGYFAGLTAANSTNMTAVGRFALNGASGQNLTALGTDAGSSSGAHNNSTYLGAESNIALSDFDASGNGSGRIAIGRGALAATNCFAAGGPNATINKVVFGKGQFDVPDTAGMANTGVIITTTSPRTGVYTNVVASNGSVTVAGAQGTGNGAGGDVIVSTATAGSSGSTLNALVERIRAKSATEVVVNDTGVDFDFRVEGDADANLLFVDAGADRVGIGNNTPAEKLHVSGNAKLVSALLDGSVSGTFTLSAADTTTSYGVKMPSAQGAASSVLQNDGSGNLSWAVANLPTQGAGTAGKFLVSDGTNASWDTVVNQPGDATIDFRVAGASDTNLLFTDSSADAVGIGTNTPSTKLDVVGSIKSSADIQSISQNGGQLAGTRNRIINGATEIDQRNAGASITLTGSALFPVDRFKAIESSDGVMTAQRVTDAPAGFKNSVRFTTTTADATLSATEFVIAYQQIEGNNLVDFSLGTASAKTFTLSFWVKSSLTGTFGGSFLNSAQNRSYPYEYSIASANTWEYKTVTLAGDTSGTWLIDSGVGIFVMWGLGVGSNLSGTAGAWAGVQYYSATGAVSVIGTVNATWQVTGVQLEIGSVATPFEWRNFQQELAMCQRYYYRIKATAVGDDLGAGYNALTTTARAFVPFPVTMRTAPTALETTGTAGDYSVRHAATTTTASAGPVFAAGSVASGSTSVDVASGLTAGQGSMLRAVNTNAFLGWSAEL
jgi:hypothetical protein